MTRRIVWSIVALLVLTTIASAWFFNRFEPVAVSTRERPEGQARRDRYLAFERFLGRMGRPLTRTSDPQALDRLPAASVMILAPGRRYHLTPARRDRLFAWIAGGGYLLVVPERDDDTDQVIEMLNLEWANPWSKWESDEDDQEAEPLPKMPETIELVIPETARTLEASFMPGLTTGDWQPDWTAGDPTYGAAFIHFSHGRGAITVIASFDRVASNASVGERDHAEILWTLLTRYQPTGAVMLVSRMHVPTLFEWLGERAVAPLTSLAIVVGLWLWHIVPRRGRLLPETLPPRRELREHLRAIGVFMWRSGALGELARAARRAVHGRRVETSLGAIETAQAFTSAMRSLQRVERNP
jgi:hypothetical protein